MFQEERSSAGENAGEMAEELAESTPMSAGDPVALAAAASVLYSWYSFYVKENEAYGIFVGLWAPTLLAAAGYLQQRDLITRVKRGISSF